MPLLKKATIYRALSRQMTYKDTALYGSSLPCMGWLRLVGSLQLRVSFAEYHLFHRALLQKETYNFKEPTSRSHPIGSLIMTCIFSQLNLHIYSGEFALFLILICSFSQLRLCLFLFICVFSPLNLRFSTILHVA